MSAAIHSKKIECHSVLPALQTRSHILGYILPGILQQLVAVLGTVLGIGLYTGLDLDTEVELELEVVESAQILGSVVDFDHTPGSSLPAVSAAAAEAGMRHIVAADIHIAAIGHKAAAHILGLVGSGYKPSSLVLSLPSRSRLYPDLSS